LIVSPKVFSSSEKFASFAKSTGWATLVGERTGGDGLGADPVLVKLPHSHLIVRLPLIMGVTEQGVINEEKKTEPDIWADTTKNPILLEDHAVRAILDHR
jgi:C-terminal processing protease CtpA/Prc